MTTQPEIHISASAIAKILAIDVLDTSKESAGVLLGYQEEGRIIITDIDTGRQKQTATFVVMDDDALVQIVEDLIRKGKENEYLVGWWHTHPGYSCFLSGTDKGTQRVYQNLYDKSVAMVIDPLKYYSTMNQHDLEVQFFRLIDDFDYKTIPYSVFVDEQAKFLASIVDVKTEWEIPKLSEETVQKLHQKLYAVKTKSIAIRDKKLLHGLIDILSNAKEKDESQEKNEILVDIDEKLGGINKEISRLYDDETLLLYGIMNLVAVIIVVISWFLIAYFV